MRSQWRLIEVKNGIAFIEDLDGPVSVTNEAERVLWHLMAIASRVVYLDTYGEWTEIAANPDTQGMTVIFKPWHGMVWDTLGR
jgi:hypothetical protein